MPVQSGDTLLHYRIVERIGEGGMGVVYRARDTKLDREVAVKVLPEAFARDEKRVARFEREARLLAALNHPNLAAIHDFAADDGVRFLVMELVEGETLGERIGDRPMPLDEALSLFRQIAEALEFAHDHGVIHRDLKPANVKITPEGRVKILDFGLAKAFESPTGSGSGATATATLDSQLTAQGHLLGTPAYMSPEQARGQTADKRADIWAFGCCLYEALSGRRLFTGPTATDLFAEIVKTEPDWKLLPATTHRRIRRLLSRCLEKDPQRRLRDIGEARFEIDEASSDPDGPLVPGTTPERRARGLRPWLGMLLGVVLGAALVTVVFWAERAAAPSEERPARFVITPPQGVNLSSFAGRDLVVSGDGGAIAFLAGKSGNSGLYLRRLDDLEARLVPNSENAVSPCFSPDGQWLAFFDDQDRMLRKASLGDGKIRDICEMQDVRGCDWSEDGTIFIGTAGGLYAVAEEGGEAVVLIEPGPEDAVFYALPQSVPGTAVVLFVVFGPKTGQTTSIAALDLRTKRMKVLGPGDHATFVPRTGHLLIGRNGSLYAQRFDSRTLELQGAPTKVVDNIRGGNFLALDAFVSPGGVLAYVPDLGAQQRSGEIVLFDRSGGTAMTAAGPFENPRYPRLSPGGGRLALTTGVSGFGQIWVCDLAGASEPVNLTFEGHNTGPVWSPDGERIAFTRATEGVYTIRADGSSLEPQLLFHRDDDLSPEAWARDGMILLTRLDADGSGDIWIVADSGDADPVPLVSTAFDERDVRLSTDGNWLAYSSNRGGDYDVWVREYPSGAPVRVSTGGGVDPVWSRDGSELFFQRAGRLLGARVLSTEGGFRTATPEVVLERGFVPYLRTVPRSYDVHPGGSIVAVRPVETGDAQEIVVVLDWFAELEGQLGGS